MAKTLLDVLPEMGVEIEESSNGRWVAVCPFHEGDRDPSFTVYTHNDTYFCFGCQVWGDPVKFLCDYKGMTSKEAQEYVGIDYEFKKAEKDRIIKTRDTLRTWEFLGRVSLSYHNNLLSTAGAKKYLESRGLSDDTIRKYKLGYTDGRVLQIYYAEDFRIAHECGIVNKQGYETLGHRITIPNYNDDPRNKSVDFIMGRTVINDKIKYLGTRMPKPIYGMMATWKSPIVFLVEGQFDWLILSQWGYPAVVLSGSHLPKYHFAALKSKMVIIVPDNDDVGRASAQKLHKSFPNSHILQISGYKDMGEMGAAGKQQDFDDLVREQEWYKTIHSSKEYWMQYLPNSLTTNSLVSI